MSLFDRHKKGGPNCSVFTWKVHTCTQRHIQEKVLYVFFSHSKYIYIKSNMKSSYLFKKSWFYILTPIWEILKRITLKVLKTYELTFTEAFTGCVHQANIQISQNIHLLHSIYVQTLTLTDKKYSSEFMNLHLYVYICCIKDKANLTFWYTILLQIQKHLFNHQWPPLISKPSVRLHIVLA